MTGEIEATHDGFQFLTVCSMIDSVAIVNHGAYMDFKKATDVLCNEVAHADLAGELGVSIATVRQARLSADAKAKRSAPVGWEAGVAKLAEARARRLLRLAEKLRTLTPS
ncbi:MAG: hypothetical protein ABUL43_02305 [Hyphomicrobium sp.]